MAGLPGGSPGKRSLLPVPHLLRPVLWGQDRGDPFEQVCKGKFPGWLQRPGLGTLNPGFSYPLEGWASHPRASCQRWLSFLSPEA